MSPTMSPLARATIRDGRAVMHKALAQSTSTRSRGGGEGAMKGGAMGIGWLKRHAAESMGVVATVMVAILVKFGHAAHVAGKTKDEINREKEKIAAELVKEIEKNESLEKDIGLYKNAAAHQLLTSTKQRKELEVIKELALRTSNVPENRMYNHMSKELREYNGGTETPFLKEKWQEVQTYLKETSSKQKGKDVAKLGVGAVKGALNFGEGILEAIGEETKEPRNHAFKAAKNVWKTTIRPTLVKAAATRPPYAGGASNGKQQRRRTSSSKMT